MSFNLASWLKIAALGLGLSSLSLPALASYVGSDPTGTVTSVSVTTQNGVSAIVTNPTTTPALAFTLGAIAPSSVNGIIILNSNTPTWTIGSASGVPAVTASSPLVITSATGNITCPTCSVTGSSVASISLGTTGLTPNTVTIGAVVVDGVLNVAHGGTNAATSSITAFNNITGYTATGATGTTSTNLVFSTSPTFITPTLGAATATSLNGNIFTAGTYTLTGTAGKTLTFSNTLTLAGTDATTMTFPTTSGTVDVLNNAQTFAAAKTFPTNDIIMGGSSTGVTTFASANSSATNYTITYPAATGTVALTSGANVASITGDGTIINNSASTGAVTLTLTNAAATSVLANTTSSPTAPSYSAAPVLGTSLTSPLIIGGTVAASTLILESTSGTGTTDAIIFKTASQAEKMRINSTGGVGIGTATITNKLDVNGAAAIGYSGAPTAPTNGLAVSGHTTFEGVTSTGATGTGNLVYSISPTFTSAPSAPTATAGTSTTQLATTAFVLAASQSYKITPFTANGTFTTSSSSSASTIYRARVLGAGGGGGGANGSAASGGGGGAGGYAEFSFTGIGASTGITITIGAAGTAGTTLGASGGTGGTSTIGTPISVSCTGGIGGTGSTAATSGINAGGAGGTCSGSPAFTAAGESGSNGNGLSGTILLSGNGANSEFGGGGDGASGNGAIGANPGACSGYGSGGGGGVAAVNAGTAGCVGTVIIEQMTP